MDGEVPVAETETEVCQLLAVSAECRNASITNLHHDRSIRLTPDSRGYIQAIEYGIRYTQAIGAVCSPCNSAEYVVVVIGDTPKQCSAWPHRRLTSNPPSVALAADYSLCLLPPTLRLLSFDNTSVLALANPCSPWSSIQSILVHCPLFIQSMIVHSGNNRPRWSVSARVCGSYRQERPTAWRPAVPMLWQPLISNTASCGQPFAMAARLRSLT